MAKACGRSAMESIWTPLLKGKFDRYYETVSMAWLWARIHTRANSRKPGQSREQLGYFRGGFAVVVRRLESELRKRNVRIELNSVVQSFSDAERSVVINGRHEPFDFCIFTGPSSAFARVLPDKAEAGRDYPQPVEPGCPQPAAAMDSQLSDYTRQLRSIDYLGAICLVFASDQNIGEYYWLNVNEPGAPFLVFLNHTRLVDKSHYQGKHVYYIGTYVPTDHALFGMTDDALADLWWGYLQKMFPEFDRQRVSERHIFRLKAAQHIVDTGYQSKIPDYKTPLPGVFLANFSQIFPEDRGTNWAVSEGKKVAGMVKEEAKRRSLI
jgi:protoporphyrinogen oxidase